MNGGAVYAVDINRTGYLRVQRQVKPQSLAYFMVEDVVLTPPYLSADKFVPGSATSKVVRGATTATGVDSDGSRRALLYFPPSTRITNYTVADGTQMDVQVTEYTVGNGPKRMPGSLPASSGYTYAVGVTLPAALAAGVQDVHFDKNVSIYTNNFTGSRSATTAIPRRDPEEVIVRLVQDLRERAAAGGAVSRRCPSRADRLRS